MTGKTNRTPAMGAELATEQLGAVRGDIEQMRALFLDAIEGLVTSFTNIARLSSGSGATPCQSGPARERMERLREETHRAMICLQFQDLLDQLLTQTLERLDRIEDALGVGRSGETSAGRAVGFPWVEGHGESGGSAPARRAAPERRVVQQSMRPGDVELF